MVGVAMKAQRLANDLLKPAARKQTAAPPATVGTAPLKEQVIHFINKKLPGGLPKRTAARAAGHRGQELRPHHPQPGHHHGRHRGGVLLSGLWVGAPCSAKWAWPPRPCCGTRAFKPCCRRAICAAATRSVAAARPTRPSRSSPTTGCSSTAWPTRSTTLDIKTVVVSCGTCYDQLQGYKFEEIFPGCRIVDIHEYLLEKGITLQTGQGEAGLPVPRPLPQPDEAAGAHDHRARTGRPPGAAKRALLWRKRHPGRHPPRQSPPRFAFAKKKNCARARRTCAP